MLCRYYISQQLTDKSDVYSFGVILLELISGQEAISNESFGVNCRNIVQWVSVLNYELHLMCFETFYWLFSTSCWYNSVMFDFDKETSGMF